MAILGGARRSVLLLLDHGASVNSRGGHSQVNKSAVFVAVQRGQQDIVELLLDRGADVNWRSHSSHHTWTSLFAAVANNDHGMVAILLRHGAQVLVKNSGNPARICGDARTAYREAVKKGFTEIAALLASHAGLRQPRRHILRRRPRPDLGMEIRAKRYAIQRVEHPSRLASATHGVREGHRGKDLLEG